MITFYPVIKIFNGYFQKCTVKRFAPQGFGVENFFDHFSIFVHDFITMFVYGIFRYNLSNVQTSLLKDKFLSLFFNSRTICKLVFGLFENKWIIDTGKQMFFMIIFFKFVEFQFNLFVKFEFSLQYDVYKFAGVIFLINNVVSCISDFLKVITQSTKSGVTP